MRAPNLPRKFQRLSVSPIKVGDGEIATAVADHYLPKETEAARKALSPQYALLEEIVERIAKELGVSKEVMAAWHGAVSGASVGGAVGSIVGGAAAIGLCAGVIVGVVIVVIGLLTDDSEEQAEKAAKKFADHLTWARTKLDFEQFEAEQRHIMWDAIHVYYSPLIDIEDARAGKSFPGSFAYKPSAKEVKLSIAAEQMGDIFRELSKVLTGSLRELMLDRLNLSRWKALRIAYLNMLASKPKPTEDQANQIRATIATIEHLIDVESKKASEVDYAELEATAASYKEPTLRNIGMDVTPSFKRVYKPGKSHTGMYVFASIVFIGALKLVGLL